MLYRIIAEVQGEEVDFGVYRVTENEALDIGEKILETIKFGKVIINRRLSLFRDWDWFISIGREEPKVYRKA